MAVAEHTRVRNIGDAVAYLLPKDYIEKFPGESYEDLSDNAKLLLRVPEQTIGSPIFVKDTRPGILGIEFWMVGEPIQADEFRIETLDPLTDALFNGIREKHRGTSVETYFKRPDGTNARVYAYSSRFPINTEDLDKAYAASVEFMRILHGEDFQGRIGKYKRAVFEATRKITDQDVTSMLKDFGLASTEH